MAAIVKIQASVIADLASEPIATGVVTTDAIAVAVPLTTLAAFCAAAKEKPWSVF